jgi:translation initiation factor IF-2-like protein
VAIHLTPTELAEEMNMKRREVIARCMEMGVPIFNGRIDKTLFLGSLRRFAPTESKQPQAAA